MSPGTCLGSDHEVHDPEFPVVCFDEAYKQLMGEARETLPMRRSQAARHDCEDQRRGMGSPLLFCKPFCARRHVNGAKHREKADWAYHTQELVDVWSPDAKRIRVVMDNLSTHELYVL